MKKNLYIANLLVAGLMTHRLVLKLLFANLSQTSQVSN